VANLEGLDPQFYPWAVWWVDFLRSYDPRLVVTSAFRSTSEQIDLWNRYQAGGTGVYTPLPPGRSQHERGFAVDLARLGVSAISDPFLAEAGSLWRQLGGVWGGERDPVHFEAPKAWTGRL
jgi:D-alanyl-D-alanine carboxypeptidase